MVGHRVPLEVAKTVLEVADVAWTAVECCHHHTHHHDTAAPSPENPIPDVESVRRENERLRLLLEDNLSIFQQISTSPSLLQNCPPDLHERLLAAVNSGNFLNQFESMQQKSVDDATSKFPFGKPSGEDLEKAEILINVGYEEPSWWVWVTEDMVPSNSEEQSEIDNDNYLIVNEELVVDGVANFMARCILANPKAQNLTPKDIQKALTKALQSTNKVEKMLDIWHAGMLFYTLATWGLALAGLYKSRAILRLAAKGVHTSSKLALKAL